MSYDDRRLENELRALPHEPAPENLKTRVLQRLDAPRRAEPAARIVWAAALGVALGALAMGVYGTLQPAESDARVQLEALRAEHAELQHTLKALTDELYDPAEQLFIGSNREADAVIDWRDVADVDLDAARFGGGL